MSAELFFVTLYFTRSGRKVRARRDFAVAAVDAWQAEIAARRALDASGDACESVIVEAVVSGHGSAAIEIATV